MEFHGSMSGRHASLSMPAFPTEHAYFVILSVGMFSLNGVIPCIFPMDILVPCSRSGPALSPC